MTSVLVDNPARFRDGILYVRGELIQKETASGSPVVRWGGAEHATPKSEIYAVTDQIIDCRLRNAKAAVEYARAELERAEAMLEAWEKPND